MQTARKKILFVMRQGPHGNSTSLEMLDILLMASSFDHDISLLFITDGIFQLMKNQDTSLLDVKNFTSAYKALSLYNIDKIYVSESDLQHRKINEADLLLPITALNDLEISELMQQQHLIFNS